MPQNEFRRRILLVDDDLASHQSCLEEFAKQDIEVVTATNGFEALQKLRGSKPDLLITELNLAHMSGFELLSVVRTRFPQIGSIATSREYTRTNVPIEAICDGFVSKGPNFLFELMEAVMMLLNASPIRASRPRTDAVPLWIPRSAAGYIVVTCPECLRSFPVNEPQGSSACEMCVFCGVGVRFQISRGEEQATPPNGSPLLRSRMALEQSRETIRQSRSVHKEKPDTNQRPAPPKKQHP